MEYFDIYKKRLNRFGNDYSSRIQGHREEEFEHFLIKSPSTVSFQYNDQEQLGALERDHQDETQTTYHFLTRIDLEIPNGTLLELTDRLGKKELWMVYWLEEYKSKGYNRYMVLKMSHLLTWHNSNGEEFSSWVYFHGKGSKVLRDTRKGGGFSANSTTYFEDENSYYIIMPLDITVQKDSYIEITIDTIKEGYRVEGYDRQSTPGVQFVSLEPSFVRDLSPAPEQKEGDSDDDFYWLNSLEGGK